MISNAFSRCATLFLVALLGAGAVAAQDYPNRRVTVIVPFGPGGPGDLLLRTVTDKLSQKWNQPVLVEYKPGAGGLLAHEFVAKAAADGYTLLQGATSFTLFHLLTKDLRFDPLKDLTIAAITGVTSFVIATSGAAPVNNMAEWTAWAKANPGKLNYGSLGRSIVMMSMELLAAQAGVKLTEVPFKTQPEMVQGLIRNDIQLVLAPVAQMKPLIDEGRVKALFAIAPTRFSALPNVPTNAEAGLPNYRPLVWQSIMAPSATPTAVLNRINAEVAAIVSGPDYPVMAERAGMRPFNPSLDEIRKLTDETVAGWTAVARSLNMKPE